VGFQEFAIIIHRSHHQAPFPLTSIENIISNRTH
jgi:hypothetical protein